MRKLAIESDRILKDDKIEELPFRIYIVLNDNEKLSEARIVLETKVNDQARTYPTLTKRESEVLACLAEGLSSKEVASSLHISVNTVNTHRQRIIEKMGVRNTAEAVKRAGC